MAPFRFKNLISSGVFVENAAKVVKLVAPKFPIQIPNQSIFTETCFGSSIFVSSILQLVFLLKKKIFVSVSCKLSYEDREDEEGGRTFQFCFLVKQYLRVFDPFTSGNRSEMLLFLFIVGKVLFSFILLQVLALD
uniref:Uncharacterized protein n=1 Tax=Gossypium raimondii TaxID=29730 RepID=A0A0D2VMG9_GOSRA|nr:hypothetical protein B456_011G147100 [Gossypium raimondii]